MGKMQEAQVTQDQTLAMEAQESLRDINGVFDEALSIEPTSVEALFRYAHFKSMLGDFNAALEYASKALALARSKDEIEELKKLTIMSAAQVNAVKVVQKLYQ